MILAVFLSGCVLFALAYRFYGRFLERQLDVDEQRPTPAHTLRDDVDYMPASSWILFGHHFSTIAGAGPIVGPVIAALAFGWLPAVLWILVGAVLVGGVHDFAAMIASIRNGGRSIGQICREVLSPAACRLFLVFILFTLIYVIIVFLDITAGTFVPAGAVQDDAGLRQGGAVATASLLYILLAVLFGICIYRLKVSVRKGSLVFVPLVFGVLWLGSLFPLTADRVPQLFGSGRNFWLLLLSGYCLAAAMLPVWMLLQPRDYLASWLLYACLFGGAAGLVLSGMTGRAVTAWPMFTGFTSDKLGFVFPALFVTVACGAVSGFHSVVASGTTARQLSTEGDALRVGYGSMLVEGILALLAVASVMLLPEAPAGKTPVAVFGAGLGTFLQVFGIPAGAAATFAMLTVSTFLLTTLDSCTRLARFLLEELLQISNRFLPRFLSTAAVMILPLLAVFQQIPGPDGRPLPAWQALWPVFGACNQLLAALALVVIYVWMRHQGRKAWFVFVPMMFMLVTTLTALVQLIAGNLFVPGPLFDTRHVIGAVSLLLTGIAVTILGSAVRSLRRENRVSPAA